MRLLRSVLIPTLLFLAVLPLSAQTLLTGRTTDTTGLPLPNINMVVYAVGSKSIAAYGVTDTEGRYSISVDVQADSLDLKVLSAFFENKILRIANRSQHVDFTLRDEVQHLKGVTVRAKSIDQRSDTLEYHVGSFVQRQDKTIEDVLKRMPGIEVEDNGRITYQGLPIQKFYVEGMDLMEGNYTAVSKNLPPQSVSSVEVYENHQPVKMLEGRVDSEQASLNIKLAKDVTLTGTAKVGVGAAPFLWNVNLTPMLFSGKVQLLAAYRSNNAAEDLSLYTKALTYEDLLKDRPRPLEEELSVRTAATPLFDSRRYMDNVTHLINLNTLTPVSSTTQMRVNIYYINDLQKHSVSQRNTLFLAADTLFFSEDIDNRHHDSRLFGTVTLSRNDKMFYLDNKTHFSRQWNHAEGLVVNNGIPVSQALRTPAASVDNDLRLLVPVGERLLNFSSYVGYGSTPHTLEVTPGPFTELLNDSLPYGSARQGLDSRQFFADHAISVLFSSGRFSIRPKAGFLITEQRVASLFLLMGGGQQWQSPAAPDASVRRLSTKPYLEAEATYKLQRLSASFSLPLALQTVSASGVDGHGESMTRLLFNPILHGYVKVGGFWTFSASAQLLHRIENYDSWMDAYLLTDYQSWVLRQAPFSLSKTLSSSVGVQFKDPFMALNANARYGIGCVRSETLLRYDVGEGGSTELQVVAMPNKHLYQTLSWNIRKYFSPLRTSVGLKGNAADTRGVSLVNGMLLNVHNLSYSLSPSLMAKLTSWLNTDYSLNYTRIISIVDGRSRSNISYWRHFAKVFAFLGRNQTATIAAEYYRHQGKPYFFVDAAYEFSVTKPRLDFELRWNNIFNSRRYVSYYSGVFSVQETVYRLRPAEATASVRFRF